jgi:hypothetical protein
MNTHLHKLQFEDGSSLDANDDIVSRNCHKLPPVTIRGRRCMQGTIDQLVAISQESGLATHPVIALP